MGSSVATWRTFVNFASCAYQRLIFMFGRAARAAYNDQMMRHCFLEDFSNRKVIQINIIGIELLVSACSQYVIYCYILQCTINLCQAP